MQLQKNIEKLQIFTFSYEDCIIRLLHERDYFNLGDARKATRISMLMEFFIDSMKLRQYFEQIQQVELANLSSSISIFMIKFSQLIHHVKGNPDFYNKIKEEAKQISL